MEKSYFTQLKTKIIGCIIWLQIRAWPRVTIDFITGLFVVQIKLRPERLMFTIPLVSQDSTAL